MKERGAMLDLARLEHEKLDQRQLDDADNGSDDHVGLDLRLREMLVRPATHRDRSDREQQPAANKDMPWRSLGQRSLQESQLSTGPTLTFRNTGND